jgi:hypothetical protein
MIETPVSYNHRMKTSEIITAIIAIYGAVLSTVTILRQYFGDRVKVRLTVQKSMEMVGDPRYQGMRLTILTLTNIGKRPVTIKILGAIRLHPNSHFVATDNRPPLPCEITEGQFVTSIWDQKDIDFSTIDYWAGWDSRDKIHKLREASLLKHWKSGWQQKWAFRRANED